MMSVVPHQSSLGAAFDAFGPGADEPFAEESAAPPSFSEATAAATATYASRSGARPTIPVYVAPLRQRISDVEARHGALAERLEALGDVPARIAHHQEIVYLTSGLLTAQKARLKTLQADDAVTFKIYSNMINTFVKRLVSKRSARSKAVQLAKQAYDRAHADLERHQQLISETESKLTNTKADLITLEAHKVEYLQLTAQLDVINDGLFAGPTPEFPEEDMLEWEHSVLTETSKLLRAEGYREQRARKLLKEASPSLKACIRDLQKALQHCINAGVPQNQKYARQLFVNGTTSSTVKATAPLVLQTKTNSGKFFTTIARARGSQALVNPAPTFTILELYLLPGNRNPKAVDERGLHKSMESSYAQARHCETYLRTEIALSLERQKKLHEQGVLLDAHIKEAKRELDVYRRRIVVAVTRGDEASLLPTEDTTGPSTPQKSPPGKVTFSLRDLRPKDIEGPVIVGKVINEAILRETVALHTRQRSFSLKTTGSIVRNVEVAPVTVSSEEAADGAIAAGAAPPSSSVETTVFIQSTRDPSVAATVALSAVTDVETPAERMRKEALRRLRAILAHSVGTPDSEELPSFFSL